MSLPYTINFGDKTLERALTVDLSAEAHEDFLLEALEALQKDGGCKLDISVLKDHVEELRFLRSCAQVGFLNKAEETATRALGEAGFKSIVGKATGMFKQCYPRICNPENIKATVANALDGGRDAFQSPAAREACERSLAPTTPRPRTRRPARMSNNQQPEDGNEDNMSAAESDLSAPLSSIQRTPPVPAERSISIDLSNGAVALIDIASEARRILRLTHIVGEVIATGTSLHYVFDISLASVFDASNPNNLDDIPKLAELMIDCISGLTTSTQHLKASYTSHAGELSSVTPISSLSQLTAVLELINKLDEISSGGKKQHDSKELTALKDAIKRYDDSNGSNKKAKEVTNTRIKAFLHIGKATLRRLEAVVSIGMVYHLLSNCTVAQILEGLKVENEALEGIRTLASQLAPEVPFDANMMSGLDALKMVLPALSSKDDSIRRLAIDAVIDIVDNIDYMKGRDTASTEARTHFWFDKKNGPWRRLQFLRSRRSASGDAEDLTEEDETVEGYFVDTRSDEERAKRRLRTHADRRQRLKVIFMVFALQGPINRRDPDWAFTSPGNAVRNIFTLSASEVVTHLKILVSKEYFDNEWGRDFTRKIKEKREAADKAARNAKEYGVLVRRTVVIDDPRQLESLKELYAKYAQSNNQS